MYCIAQLCDSNGRRLFKLQMSVCQKGVTDTKWPSCRQELKKNCQTRTDVFRAYSLWYSVWIYSCSQERERRKFYRPKNLCPYLCLKSQFLTKQFPVLEHRRTIVRAGGRAYHMTRNPTKYQNSMRCGERRLPSILCNDWVECFVSMESMQYVQSLWK